jgi:hypothetical protein
VCPGPVAASLGMVIDDLDDAEARCLAVYRNITTSIGIDL